MPVGDVVRLHIIPEDNTQAAQMMKHRLREDLTGRIRGLFAGCADGDEVWSVAKKNQDRMLAWARAAAAENGYHGNVSISVGIHEFEERIYEGMVFPAGEYRTILITMGDGAGDNWWCVLYPSLCLPEDYRPGMKVEFYSSVARWLKNVFGGWKND